MADYLSMLQLSAHNISYKNLHNKPVENPVDYLKFLRFTAHHITCKNLSFTFPEEVQEEEKPEPVVMKIKRIEIYFDKNNRFNMLADAF